MKNIFGECSIELMDYLFLEVTNKILFWYLAFKSSIAYIFPGVDHPRYSPVAKVVKLFMKWGEELVDNNKGYYPILGICMGIEIFALYAYDNGKVNFHNFR